MSTRRASLLADRGKELGVLNSDTPVIGDDWQWPNDIVDTSLEGSLLFPRVELHADDKLGDGDRCDRNIVVITGVSAYMCLLDHRPCWLGVVVVVICARHDLCDRTLRKRRAAPDDQVSSPSLNP